MVHSKHPFQQLIHNADNHLALYTHAVVLELLYHLGERGINDPLARFPFLESYLRQLTQFMDEEMDWQQARLWWRRHIQAWEEESAEHLPLLALQSHGKLRYEHMMVLVLVGALEDDSRFGLVFQGLQRPDSGSRPSLEFLRGLVPADFSVLEPMLAMGLLTVENVSEPRSEWGVKVPLLLWNYCRGQGSLQGEHGFREHKREDLVAFEDLFLEDNFRQQLERVPHILTEGLSRVMILKGHRGNNRIGPVGAVARALNKGLLEVVPSPHGAVNSNLIGPLCALAGCIPLFRRDMAPGESFLLPHLGGYHGIIAVICGHEGGYEGEHAALTLEMPFPDRYLRAGIWQQALGEFGGDWSEEIATRFHLGEGTIRRTAAQAVLQARLDGAEQVHVDHVRRACRFINRQSLDALASPITAGGDWDQLVVGNTTNGQLLDLSARCRQREQLLEHLTPACLGSANRGVRALFTGPSGTGKTLAARILATQLGMDLFRVDLASVVSKYIGETEKNLHMLLSRAETLDVVLLIDEGDALMGNRTEVRGANDRYANLETNFLLQRMEAYQGIILITTNAREYIDKAFERRMDAVIHFLSPRAEERLHLWRVHLGETHQLEQRDLEQLAGLCELSGGQIRNAAIASTLAALEQGCQPHYGHLLPAVAAEFRKMGAVCPLRPPSPVSSPVRARHGYYQ